MRIRQKVDLMVFHSACKASLSEAARDEESMIVIPGSLLFLSILWVKRGRSKKCQSSKNSQNSLAYWSLEAAWIGWMTEVVKILMIGIAGMDVRKNREMTSCCVIEGVLLEIVSIVLWTSKGRIGRWKIAEMEEQIFCWDCRSGFMHK